MRRILLVVSVVVVFAAGVGVWLAVRPEPQTPCQATVRLVHDIRGKARAGEGSSVALIGPGYAQLFRGIAAGTYTDVDGPARPELREALYRLARHFEGLPIRGEPWQYEFAPGELTDTAIGLDHVLGICGQPDVS